MDGSINQSIDRSIDHVCVCVCARARKVAQHPHDRLGLERVKPRGRLVQEQHAWVRARLDATGGALAAVELQLASLQSVKDLSKDLKAALGQRGLDRLVCNAAVYLPTDPKPRFTDDGFEMSLGVNHLGHFLLVQLLLPQLQRAKDSRCCIVGSVTGNKNTVAGSLVKPVADVGELEGLASGPGEVS